MPTAPPLIFPNYMQLRERSRISLTLWSWLRTGMLLAMLALAVVLLVAPAAGLFVLWRLVIPILPLVFLVAPGLWRNVCPLAASNQAPRLLRFTRALTPPGWFKEYGYVIGFVSFFILASSRKWLFNANGTASGLLLILALAGALAGGYLFKGKSGWCSSICPLYPVQRLYNQTPFVTVPNSHCTPCVGCTKNCYDFNPAVAYLADLYDDDRYYTNYRKFFAGAMPGFIFAYFTLPDPPAISILSMYLQFALAMLVSSGLFYIADAFLKVSTNKLTALYGAAAINLFYWFGLPVWFKAVGSLFGLAPLAQLPIIAQGALLLATAAWVVRTYRKESVYVSQVTQPDNTRVAPGAAQALSKALNREKAEITFLPGNVRIVADLGRNLLEIAEKHRLPIEAGCRMGMCGADPVLITGGMENVAPPGAEERGTLDRLGLGGNMRLACMCRVKGAVTVALNEKTAAAPPAPPPVAAYDARIRSVVIIGNGVAGVTAADYIRRLHPACDIHLVALEKHPLYNRMGISRLIYGRSAMNGLYLQPESWYEERKITSWLNTKAMRIDTAGRRVELGIGESLPYDRLILAMGSSSSVPGLPGFSLPGAYVLRDAEQAMDIRAYIQSRQCRNAVIAGGGLLGLEAGYAISKLGVHVSILERGEWLLRRQLDERSSSFLRQHLEALGMEIILRAEAAEVRGQGRVAQIVLRDGRCLACDLLLAAMGIRPNTDLAQAAGIQVGRGILVDETMRTSNPDIYAAGDVVEYNQQVPGLWPVAVEQAKVAATNALGGQARYVEAIPVTALKVVGVDLTSIGRFEARTPGDIVIALEDAAEHRYRKLVIADGKVVGAILLGYPQDAPAVTAVVKQGADVSHLLQPLRQGRWEVLADT